MDIVRIPMMAGLLLLAAPAAGAQTARQLHDQALAHYDRALEAFGLALGERSVQTDPARSFLLAEVAELICLKGDAEGCRQASEQADRELGPYAEPLVGHPPPDPAGIAAGRSFLVELHRQSTDWADDRSLASEGSGLLAQIEADRLRRRAARTARPAFEQALRRARGRPATVAIPDWLEAVQQAGWMLDQPALVRACRGLAKAVLAVGGPAGQDAARLAAALARGRETMSVLGLESEPGFRELQAALDLLAVKELAAADLDFALGPAAERFETDLLAAHQQLAAVARLAPLHSRASAILTFLSAYAGVLASEPGAAAALVDLSEDLALTDPYLAARARGLVGRDALLAGDFYRAARVLGQAATAMAARSAAGPLVGLLLANRAQALFYLGDYPGAAGAFGRAAGRLAGRAAAAFRARLGQAHAWVFADRPDPARQAFARAEALLAEVPEAARAGLSRQLRLDRALLLLHQRQADRAVDLLSAVAAEALAAGDLRAGTIARTNLAEVYNDQARPERALTEAQAALKWIDPASQADAAWQAHCEKARALARLGRTAEAEREFGLAMDLVERLRARIGAEGSRRTFAAAKQRLYQAATSLLVGAGKPRAAFEVSERARGRAFLDMLGERRVRLGDPAAERRLEPARARMLRALPPLVLGLDELAEVTAGPGGPPAGPAPEADPRQGWLSLVTVNPARVADVQAVLGPGEGLVSFFHDGHTLYGWLITRDGIEQGTAEVDRPGLELRVADLLRRLRRPGDDDAKIRRKAGRLYRLTLGPLADGLDGLERLVVVPWGPLHYVPFGALWTGRDYLVDRLRISVVPSASTLVMIRSGHPRSKAGAPPADRVLALGNPATDLASLPDAQREVGLLAKLFTGARVLTGARATKRVFLDRAQGAGMIHLASHGVFLPRRPMDSYLALAGPTPEAGRLAALEILGLDLEGARLVMLSACSSGEVAVEGGDEIVGLQRAFLHAGTPALIAGLWPLADEGALELVRRLYAGLKKGQAPAEALTRAQRELRHDPRFGHPFFWAPYELIGS